MWQPTYTVIYDVLAKKHQRKNTAPLDKCFLWEWLCLKIENVLLDLNYAESVMLINLRFQIKQIFILLWAIIVTTHSCFRFSYKHKPGS